ncbi:MAG: type I secretion system permease/ATPase [Aquincola tertiaricarbonis]
MTSSRAPGPAPAASDSALHRALQIVRRTLWSVAFFSFFINLLALTSSLYMLQVYDRVLASRSLPTLLYLTLFAAGCLATLALLEVVRSRLLVRMGVRFDAQLSGLVFRRTLQGGRTAQPLRDLDQLRNFFAGPTTLSLLDAPWMPVYIGLVYLLHPWLGHVALAGGVLLLGLGLWNERATRRPLTEAGQEMSASAQFAELSGRNAEVVQAMGMVPALSRVWRLRHDYALGLQGLASDEAANVAGVAKAFRLFLQVAILAVGAWLVILQQSTAGVMIASSIVMGRALAPLESAIGGWRGFLAAREAYRRLSQDLQAVADERPAMPLPRPTGELVFDGVSAGPPEARHFTVQGLQFRVAPGVCLGITGPSAAGKSTLARLAMGVWRPGVGVVRLDGVDIAAWRREDVGPALGYLPQDIELFPGTVASNIARFGEPDPEQVVEAARLAGAHAMILTLPQGYDTPIGPAGANLSGGQRQRIGLARAFYGQPALVVLDEPTSNLDAEGEAAVRQAMEALKAAGRTVVVIAHRPALLAGTDQLMVVVDGRIASLGPTAEVMPAITRRVMAQPEGRDLGALGVAHG